MINLQVNYLKILLLLSTVSFTPSHLFFLFPYLIHFWLICKSNVPFPVLIYSCNIPYIPLLQSVPHCQITVGMSRHCLICVRQETYFVHFNILNVIYTLESKILV